MESKEQDNEKNQQNSEESSKSEKAETIYTIKFTIFIVLLYFGIVLACIYYQKNYGIKSKNFIVDHTLSSELFEGRSYTAKSHIDDSDMWETETGETVYVYNTTTVPVTEDTEITYVTVVFPIDINLANVDELVQIEGIGTVIAERIVNYRNQYGYFYEYDELLNVEGIGEKKLSNLKRYIYIDEALISETEPPATTSEKAFTTAPTSVSTTVQTEVVTPHTTEESDYDEEFEIYEYDPYEYESEIFSETEREYYPDFPLELNSATIGDLMYIDGIGEVIAYKIVEYANMYGFYSVEDLLNVDGIGEKKLALIAPYVYVNSYMLPPKTETTLYNEWQTAFTSQAAELFQTETIKQVYSVNINTCGKEDLMQLPGIDSTLADSIISLRNQIGYFEKIEELSLADGMTNEKLSAIWNYVYVN